MLCWVAHTEMASRSRKEKEQRARWLTEGWSILLFLFPIHSVDFLHKKYLGHTQLQLILILKTLFLKFPNVTFYNKKYALCLIFVDQFYKKKVRSIISQLYGELQIDWTNTSNCKLNEVKVVRFTVDRILSSLERKLVNDTSCLKSSGRDQKFVRDVSTFTYAFVLDCGVKRCWRPRGNSMLKRKAFVNLALKANLAIILGASGPMGTGEIAGEKEFNSEGFLEIIISPLVQMMIKLTFW